jgi:dolichyl-phosphate beta-glucosyltransferase
MSLDDTYLSLIVPVYNEAGRLEAPLAAVVQYLNQNFQRWEILYVDDGSTDTTFEILQKAAVQYPELKTLRSPTNEGKGAAIRKGFGQAQGDILVFSDADFSTPIEECTRLLQLLRSGHDVVIGSRGLPDSKVEVHQSWIRESMGKIFNFFIQSLLPLDFQDTQCGFKMFCKDAASILLPRMTIRGFAFDVELLVIAKLQGMKVAEIPVTWRNVKESKVHPIRSSLQMLKDLLKIRYQMAMNVYA